MTSPDNSKQSPAAASSPRVGFAQSSDSSLSQRLEASGLRDASTELDYGCVDWFIYGADARIACGPASLTT
ncbi:MAG TPA: hypothetical protein VID71_05075 [Steroidobacteraceae bacterium]|jgi:hypothetical protein